MIPRKLVVQVLERDGGSCVIADCEGKRSAKGYCNLHYQRMLKHGDPLWTAPTMEDRFWSKVEPTGFCWHWTAATDPNGYGMFNRGRAVDRAHRVAYELLVGPVPDGLVLDHLCRVTGCCNPDHLEPVTQAENMARAQSPAMRAWRNNECSRGHSLEGAYVRPDTGHRMCRTCARGRKRRAD